MDPHSRNQPTAFNIERISWRKVPLKKPSNSRLRFCVQLTLKTRECGEFAAIQTAVTREQNQQTYVRFHYS